MRFLFAMRHPGYLRIYESALVEMTARGHEVIVDFGQKRKRNIASSLDRIGEENPGLILREDGMLSRGKDPWLPVADALRLAIDVSRYADPRYEDANLLRERMAAKIDALPLPAGDRVSRRLLSMSDDHRRTKFQRRMMRFDEALPLSERMIGALERYNPDAVIVTPVLDAGSRQMDIVRHSQALGYPVGVAVASWDNLTNKGLLRCKPDRVFVWNEAQRTEAVEMHDVAPETVAVTGAQLFDHWFTWKPVRTREEFAERTGLDPSKPFLTWLASSPFIGGDREVQYVTRWIDRLRARSGPLADYGVLIRPHPQSTAVWANVDTGSMTNVTIFPRHGANPVDVDSRQDFFESIYFSEAVIGVNSSAMIESAIVGRPVFTVLAEEFAAVQGGTIHFEHLESMLLNRAATDDELFDMLDHARDNSEALTARNTAFLKSFIRPRGLDVPATAILVDEFEALAAIGRRSPDHGRKGDVARRLALRALKNSMRARSRPGARADTDLDLPPIMSVDTVRDNRWGDGMRSRFGLRRKPAADDATEQAPAPTASSSTAVPMELQLPMIRMVAEPAQLDRELNNRFKKIAKGDTPIVLGPWTSELGFELLYWIPYLRWAFNHYDIDPARVITLTRGGAGAAFYGDIANRHVDVFDLMDHEQFREALHARWAERGGQKQSEWTRLDKDLLSILEIALDLGKYEVVHPSAMYRLFNSLWRDRMPMAMFRERTIYRPMTPPPLPPELVDRLPSRYAAVRFYYRPSFPDLPKNREFIASLLTHVADDMPIVALSTGLQFDDHEEHSLHGDGRLIAVDDVMTPTNNLAVQAAIVARASTFYGTYGGLAYLPPYYRVPSYTFFSEPEHLVDVHGTVAGIQRRTLDSDSFVLDTNSSLWLSV